MTADCAAPLELDLLLAWRLGELDAEQEARVEEHWFGCASCARRLLGLQALAEGTRRLLGSGALTVTVTVSAEAIERARQDGLAIRTYALAPGELVGCTAAPEDDFVALRLRMQVEEDETVDFEASVHFLESGERSQEIRRDLLVDRNSGELCFLNSGALIRSLPRSRWSIEARIRGPRGERVVGPYLLDHTPWEELEQPV